MGLASNLFILRLDDQRYALELAAVERVVRMVQITPLPHPPDAILGVINLQGRVIEVLDLRRRLSLPWRPPRSSDMLLIVHAGEKTMALVADTVGEIAAGAPQVPQSDAPAIPSGEFVTAALKFPDGLVLQCDLARILSGAEAAPATEPAAPGAPHEQEEAEELARVLRERARRLAVEPVSPAAPEEQLEVVRFLLSGERYAVETAHVREVHAYRELVRLPGAPAFIVGIMNVRGKIHSVMDMRRLLELSATPISDASKVIILQDASMIFGVVADAILGVQQVALDELQPPLVTLTGIRGAYVKGVTAEGLTVLDGGKILADRKLVVHVEV